tara:strand:+ start:8308 stop:8529 length:222 start_codon:yes stop_codon:yes gene_type:complete
MKKLDLHGIAHSLADEATRRFLNFVDLPCEIVTGNSTKMKKLVSAVVREYDWFCHEKDAFNAGSLIVTEEDQS